MRGQGVSKQTLHRLPIYINYLKSLPNDTSHVSSTHIADSLGLNDVQVRKDLASVSSGGRPKVGYQTERLIRDIQRFLSYGVIGSVVIVGMSQLGKALVHYQDFQEYGQKIVAVFDCDEKIAGTAYSGMLINPISKLPELCRRLDVKIGIITVPAEDAQEVCEALVESGILAIWNFAPTHLTVPEGIVVQNENMAASLAILSKRISNIVTPNFLRAGTQDYE